MSELLHACKERESWIVIQTGCYKLMFKNPGGAASLQARDIGIAPATRFKGTSLCLDLELDEFIVE